MAIYKGNQKIDGGYPIATEISSSSTNDEVAGAKAVYDFAGVKDTGWIDMSSYVNTTYFRARTEQPPMARRVNNQVYWTGEVYCTTSPNVTSADILTGFPTWLKGNGEPQYSNAGVTYNEGRPYNIFIVYSPSLGKTRIQVNEKNNIATQNQYNGFQLSNLWGYFTDTDFPTNYTTNSLNTAQLMNTGSLVGMGDRAELTSLASELTDNNIGEQEVEEVTPLETTKEKTEGSGDIL